MFKRFLVLLIGACFVLSGCSVLKASTDEINKYVRDFISIVDNADKEKENGQKVLAEVRGKLEKQEINKTKVQNVLLDGIEITKEMKDDVVKSSLPKEMEPIREKFISSLDKRIEGITSYLGIMI